jgi:glycine/D-amino acid oxidase-like deaminating enzyme
LSKTVDYIIVGQGLAGTWIGFQLIKKGCTVLVINYSSLSNSSLVAGGLYNPLLAKRQKLSYLAHEIYPHIESVYAEIEAYINHSVLKQEPIQYIVESIEELNTWSVLCETEAYKPFVKMTDLVDFPSIDAPHGVVEILHSGWVNIPELLQAFKEKLRQDFAYLDEVFNQEELNIDADGVNYRDIKAKGIVYAQGTPTIHQDIIMLKPAKGEILRVNIPKLELPFIPQQGVFMLPLGDGNFKIGSTFEWKDLSENTTEEGKMQLLKKWLNFYKGEYTIVGQEAGVRPSSNDRRPILGALDKDNKSFVFNGLGSKGVALAPYFSLQLANFITEGTAIDREVDIKRFKWL